MTSDQPAFTSGQFVRILIKTGLLFVLVNLLWAVLQPLPLLESISVYTHLVKGRTRLPYGLSAEDYNLSPSRLGTLFATHEINTPKAADEFRVIVLGDSSVWGILLRPQETLTEQLNGLNLAAADGRPMHFYNLAYPMNSVLKDRVLLDSALTYQPDLILWLVTLESMTRDNQFEPPLLLANRDVVQSVLAADGLNWDTSRVPFVTSSAWDTTLLGQRRVTADWLRLQAYGVVWSSTGIDQIYKDYTPRSNDFDTDVTWHGFTPDTPFTASDPTFDVLMAGVKRAGSVPMMFINEPVYIADGTNSDLHYNAWSPRWAYDLYRKLFAETAAAQGWAYADAWNQIPSSEFTDSPVHLTPTGSHALAQWIGQQLTSVLDSTAALTSHPLRQGAR